MGEKRVGEIIEAQKASIDSIDHRKEISMVYRPIDSIDREIVENDDSTPSQYRQRAIAEKLLKILGEPKSWKFYLKCAHHLSEDKIWSFVELAMRTTVKRHNNYFVRLANKEMNK